MKIVVTTYPFGTEDERPLKVLKGLDFSLNQKKRKYSHEELIAVLKEENPDIIIAGTEGYDNEALDICPNLKMISRVGIGLDSLNLSECQRRNIIVTHTPDAPSGAVAEITIGQMINMSRNIQNVAGSWERYIGKEIRSCNIGIFGCGRIGKLVIDKLQGLKPRRIFVNDIDIAKTEGLDRCEYADKPQILLNSDIVSLHIPLADPSLDPQYDNRDFITKSDLDLLPDDAMIINTSRGGIINEADLCEWLKESNRAKAAIDVFEDEPYEGELLSLKNACLTPHLASCTVKSRLDMEVGAAEEVVNFIKGKPFSNRVV
jgi:D-3-phosphoglycerate dehydrogenase